MWRRWMSKYWLWLLALLVGGVLVTVICGYAFGWPWTGLQPRTLWDWLQLLIIPSALGLGTLWFNAQQSQRQQQLSDRQHAADQQRANEQHKVEQELAEQRRKTDLELSQDQQRESMLQEYLNRMSELLLEKNLRASQDGDEIRQVARARTLTVLRRLDTERKTALFRFLAEAQLVGEEHNIIDLHGADLMGADLFFAELSKTNLSETNLSETNLGGANMREADLGGANMRGADLNGADLSQAKLSHADLSNTLQLHFLGGRCR